MCGITRELIRKVEPLPQTCQSGEGCREVRARGAAGNRKGCFERGELPVPAGVREKACGIPFLASTLDVATGTASDSPLFPAEPRV